jgi:two-component system phosphate regulon sensor histidine kinase PhoR
MEGRWYLVFVPLMLVAAIFLGYSSFSTTFNFETWGARSIIDSTFAVARANVDSVERKVIDSDNALLALIDLEDLPGLEEKWDELTKVSHAVDTIIILDDERDVHFYVSDHEGEKLGTVLYDFRERIRPELVLKKGRSLTLRHLHGPFGGRTYLMSYKSKQYRGSWYTICLNYNITYMKDVLLPEVFGDLAPKSLYNVVDTEGRLIVGQRFGETGEFSVARRFPSTLYMWRLQVAPTAAAVYEATSQRRYLYEIVTLVIAFFVIFAGMGFFIYAAEKERRLGVLKSEFVANVSHELKTPLSIIRLFSEMLSLGKVNDAEKEKKYHEVISRECERLTALIDNVLDFARLEGGRMQFELTEARPAEVLTSAAEIYRHRLEREKIELQMDIPDDLPTVRMDSHAITLVVVNLLDNAAKYAEGTDRVRIGAAVESGRLEISVRDWGAGIPQEDRKRIFERFYRGSDAQKRHQRGSGIGLTLVRSIVDSHKGKIRLEIPPGDGGNGTEFVVSLPI